MNKETAGQKVNQKYYNLSMGIKWDIVNIHKFDIIISSFVEFSKTKQLA